MVRHSLGKEDPKKLVQDLRNLDSSLDESARGDLSPGP